MASARVGAEAGTSVPAVGYTAGANPCPAMTPNATPSRTQSIATPVASRAASSFGGGASIEPDVSMITISAASALAGVRSR